MKQPWSSVPEFSIPFDFCEVWILAKKVSLNPALNFSSPWGSDLTAKGSLCHEKFHYCFPLFLNNQTERPGATRPAPSAIFLRDLGGLSLKKKLFQGIKHSDILILMTR